MASFAKEAATRPLSVRKLLASLAFLFGMLELGFVLLVANVFGQVPFLVWSGVPCVLLMRIGWVTARGSE